MDYGSGMLLLLNITHYFIKNGKASSFDRKLLGLGYIYLVMFRKFEKGSFTVNVR
jgi:hypothetical protein